MNQTALDVGALHTANCAIIGALLYSLVMRGYVVEVERVSERWYASAHKQHTGEELGYIAADSMADAVKQLYDYLP